MQSADLRRTLVVLGFPRSGTTWLAETVASLPQMGLIFEPLAFKRVPAARRAGCDWENFHLAGDDWPSGEAFLEEVLSGRVLNSWTASHLPLVRARQVDRWVVKFVRANQMLPWLVEHFPIPPPVFILRHPCAVFVSWRDRGWPVRDFGPPIDAPFFQHYPQFIPIIESLETPEERFAARWCMHHYGALAEADPVRYRVCFYEHLRKEGERQFRAIFDHWALALPPDLKDRITRPSSKASESLLAAASTPSPGWAARIDPDAVTRMARILEAFGLGLYGAGPDPDLEGSAFTETIRQTLVAPQP